MVALVWTGVYSGGLDADAPAVLADPGVLHVSRHQREQRVVAPESDAGARSDLRPALPNEDLSRAHDLAAVDLHAEHLRIGVAAVARRAASLLMCHLFLFLLARSALRRL